MLDCVVGAAHFVENILFSWGGCYCGAWENDLIHGHGVIYLMNGQVLYVNMRYCLLCVCAVYKTKTHALLPYIYCVLIMRQDTTSILFSVS